MFRSVVSVLLLLLFCCDKFTFARLQNIKDSQSFYVDTVTNQIMDSAGRSRLFHGVNVVYKIPPYYPNPLDKFDPILSFTEQDMQIVRDLGFNIIRFGISWTGLETSPNVYNTTYIQIMQNFVQRMQSYGLFVVLDFHQDLLSRKFCGNGIPLFYTKIRQTASLFPEPLGKPFVVDNSTNVPSDADCAKYPWADYQFAAACASAYQSLYDNVDGIQDAYLKYWKFVAKSFKDFPNVLGYELINEPWIGDFFQHPTLFNPGVADRKNLQPLYDKLNTNIRQVDEQKLLFFEPVTFSDFGSGFTSVPGGSEFRNRSVYSYHFYEPPNLSVKEHFYFKMRDVRKLQCGGMLTEFDITYGPPKVATQMVQVMDICDTYLQSWIGWQYKNFGDTLNPDVFVVDRNGTVIDAAATRLSRTYAPAVAGTVQKMQFDSNTKTFELHYRIHKYATLPTEIYINRKYHYPNDVSITVTPPQMVTWNFAPTKNNDTLLITPTDKAQEGYLISIFISPCK